MKSTRNNFTNPQEFEKVMYNQSMYDTVGIDYFRLMSHSPESVDVTQSPYKDAIRTSFLLIRSYLSALCCARFKLCAQDHR